MKVMGLGNLVHWVAWFINAASVLGVCVTLVMLLIVFGGIMPHSNVLLLLILMYFYTIASTVQVRVHDVIRSS